MREMVVVDSELLLDDKKFSEMMLEKKTSVGLSKADMVFVLRNLLKMKYYPVAVKFFYDEDELEKFRAEVDYKIACNPFTFCHFSAASRQRGDILLGDRKTLGCSNARYLFGWKEYDEQEVKSHLKYVRDWEQAEKFVKTKPRLPEGLLAFATAPLHKAPYEPDVIHIICDVLQSYHIYNDYASALDIHPIQPNLMMNSAVCGGVVWTYNKKMINVVPMCSSSYTSGKTEQGEINVYIPWEHFEAMIVRLLERTAKYGGASYPRTGETYPGFNICKLCNFLLFRKPPKED